MSALLVGISGSLRAGSYNAALLSAAAAERPAGVEYRRWSGLARLPAYSEDLDGRHAPPAVEDLRRTLAAADAVLIATPEYNASIPGGLKNVLDWASRPFPANCLRDKPVAVVGAGPGSHGAAWAQAELRKVLAAIGASVLDSELAVPAADTAFAPDGRLRHPALAAALRALVHDLLGRTLSRAA